MGVRWLWLLALGAAAFCVTGCCRRACRPECGPRPVQGIVLEGAPVVAPTPRGVEPADKRVTVRVTVLDKEGTPVRGAEVHTYAKEPRAREASVPYFQGRGGQRGREVRRTDADGVAVLADLDPAATYGLAVQAPRERPELREPASIGDWLPRDETIRLRRWYVVKGVVRDPSGRPVARAHVSAKESSVDHRLQAYTAEDGTFSIERVPEGDLPLVVELTEGVLSGPSVPRPLPDPGTVVPTGDEIATLVVDVGAELVVTLDRAPGDPPDGLAYLWKDDNGRVLATASSYVRDGVARFRGLRPDETYGLWVSPTKDGRLIYRTDVRPGDLTARREPGKTITVRVRAPANATHFGASVQGPYFTLHVEHTKAPDNQVEVMGLPDGTWRLWAYALVGEEEWLGWGSAAAGSTVEVEVKPWSSAR
jgi:hypothetical protein